RFRTAYRNYLSPTSGIEGVRFAPFTILAAEGETTARRANRWHLAECDRLAEASDFIATTERRILDPADETAVAEATRWWTTMTEGGGEGMVVKPMYPVAGDGDAGHDANADAGTGRRRAIQPGIKCLFYLLPSTFYLLHSTFYLLPSTFYILPSTFYILHSTFYILNSAFCILHSAFFILHSDRQP
ncbi:MAG: hypothetical protein F6J94_18000, partial [Moorea sp. SIO1F2]